MKIKKILIANRGEIACRIMHTCHQLGIKTVAIYAQIERHAKHVKTADEAFLIQAKTPTAAYLDADAIVKIAKGNNVDAIHPGYGFLSERSEFAKKIIAADMLFIGAPIQALELMGSKAAAKKTMIAAGVPCVPGFHGDEQQPDFLQLKADEIGYPLLIKASAGGGGKGMKIVNQATEFCDALLSAKREAMKSFADDHVILERFITRPKHIEVQVFADSHDNVVHLFERDCSSQRRYQKIIEEAPATCINQTTKDKMYAAAIAASKTVDYQGAGTIEFIVEDDAFFFMEMNTRLQVEHRVTEMITSTDLVEWQILVAAGKPLPLKQSEIKCHGHAIQARIYAEDSFNGFLPATGLLQEVEFCRDENIIIDTGVEKSNNISIHFDPMIAKTVCWAQNRQACIDKTLHNLDHTFIVGVKTNLGFLAGLLAKPEFSNNTVFTNSLDNGSLKIEVPSVSNEILATLVYKTSNNNATSAWSGNSAWSNSGTYSNNYTWLYNEEEIQFTANIVPDRERLIYCGKAGFCQNYPLFSLNSQLFSSNNEKFCSKPTFPRYDSLSRSGTNILNNKVIINHQLTATDANAIVFQTANQIQLISHHQRYIFDTINHQNTAQNQDKGNIIAPMPGKILEVKVKVGDDVAANKTVIVMEAMKMELSLKATATASVEEIFVKVGDIVTADTLLLKLV